MIRLFCIFLIGMAFGLESKAQFGLNIYEGGHALVNTYKDIQTGITQPGQIKVQLSRGYNQSSPAKWKLTVRLLDDFYCMDYKVPAEEATLRPNHNSGFGTIPGSFPSEIPLNKYSETAILNSETDIPFSDPLTLSFDLYIRGGVHLLTIPNGVYTTAYEFSLYDISEGYEQLIARNVSNSQSARFQMNYAGNHGDQQLAVVNGAEHFTFVFSSPDEVIQGKTITVTGGLRLQSYNGHQILVRTADDFMYNDLYTHALPVSILSLKTDLYNFSGGNLSDSKEVVLYPPIRLSSQEQVIASYPKWSQGIQYSLELSIPPNAEELRGASGKYETYLYFIIVPN